MTELDKWEPTGTPIHPYDLYLLVSIPVLRTMVRVVEWSPNPVDTADEYRNPGKGGVVYEVAGTRYFETTTAKSALINAHPYEIAKLLSDAHPYDIAEFLRTPIEAP